MTRPTDTMTYPLDDGSGISIDCKFKRGTNSEHELSTSDRELYDKVKKVVETQKGAVISMF